MVTSCVDKRHKCWVIKGNNDGNCLHTEFIVMLCKGKH